MVMIYMLCIYLDKFGDINCCGVPPTSRRDIIPNAFTATVAVNLAIVMDRMGTYKM